MKKLLVDTSIWIEYFKGNEVVQHIIHDTRNYRCFITGPVITELLVGIKTLNEKEKLNFCLNTLPTIDITGDDWTRTGNIGNLLRKKGITVPLTGLIIFSAAESNQCSIFSQDNHFNIIKNGIASDVETISINQLDL